MITSTTSSKPTPSRVRSHPEIKRSRINRKKKTQSLIMEHNLCESRDVTHSKKIKLAGYWIHPLMTRQ